MQVCIVSVSGDIKVVVPSKELAMYTYRHLLSGSIAIDLIGSTDTDGLRSLMTARTF